MDKQTKDIQKAYRGQTFAYRGDTNIFYYHKRKLDFINYLLELLLPVLLQIFTIQCGAHSIKPQLSATPPLTPVCHGTLKADTDAQMFVCLFDAQKTLKAESRVFL